MFYSTLISNLKMSLSRRQMPPPQAIESGWTPEKWASKREWGENKRTPEHNAAEQKEVYGDSASTYELAKTMKKLSRQL